MSRFSAICRGVGGDIGYERLFGKLRRMRSRGRERYTRERKKS